MASFTLARERQLLAGPTISRRNRDPWLRSIRDQWLDLSVGRADLVEVPPSSCARLRSSGSPSSLRLPPAAGPHRCRLRRSRQSQPARGHCAGRRSQRPLQCDLSKARRNHGQPVALCTHRLLISFSIGPRRQPRSRNARWTHASTAHGDRGRRRGDAVGRAAHRPQSARGRIQCSGCRPAPHTPIWRWAACPSL